MQEITIKDEFIKLGQALKLAVRRGRKLHPGDCFEFEGNEVKVTSV